jgi:hypothetical protein
MFKTKLITIALSILMVALAAGCSKKKDLGKTSKAIPADVDIVATIDAKALMDYAKTNLSKLVPEGMKDQFSFDKLDALTKMAGVDINKLSNVTMLGYAGSQDKMAFIAEGIDSKTIKGEKQGDHNGIALNVINNDFHYAELAEVGTVVAPSPEILKSVLDSFSGKAKNITDVERGAMMKKLMADESNLNHLRVYLLTGTIPPVMAAPFKVKGGGFFIHLDKGLAAKVLTDKAGADTLKTQLDQGMNMAKMAMAGGGAGMGMPGLDKETAEWVGKVLNDIKTDKGEDSVSVSYHGDLKPLIEKSMAMGMKQVGGAAMTPPPAPKAAPAAKPEATATKAPQAPKKIKAMAKKKLLKKKKMRVRKKVK